MTAETMTDAQALLTSHYGARPDPRASGDAYIMSGSQVPQALRQLRDQCGFDLLLDIIGIDYLSYPGHRDERFAVVYLLRHLDACRRLCLKVLVEEDAVELPSVHELFANADWLEREVYDQYGIRFSGHPNLKRLLNHHEFQGHPLRKDYPVQKRQKLSVNDPMLDEITARLCRKGYALASEPNLDDGIRIVVDGREQELLTVNMGPSHPATHGTLRTLGALDGETIAAAVCEMGYLHRGFEKMVEQGTFNMVLPYTDRLNYCSAMMNNVGFCRAAEQMFEVEVPERCQLIRVIICELSRIIDHGVCVGANLVDVGALTNFWYLYNPREQVYVIWEKLCGARLTNTFTRIGGLYRDSYHGFEDDVRGVLPALRQGVDEVLRLIEHNRIFVDRTRDICAVSPERARAWGWTGPCLRASGVDHDLRKVEPYYGYDRFDWDTVIGTTGDTFDRIMVRLYECHESLRIIEQALQQLRPGPVNVTDARLALPSKQQVHHDMESLINQFKLIYEGVRPPAGEHYGATEAANGELGYYIVSDGGTHPYRIKVRPPCFMQFAAFAELIEGHQVADAFATLGSLNVIAGELDR
jgi:NADH-quinone oxidoreductase subunit C/D